MSKDNGENSNVNKVNISSQNADTGIPIFDEDDPRPYEQKNMPLGAFKKNQGSK